MFNIRAAHQEEDLVHMNEALGDVSEGVFFDFTDRGTGYAIVKAGAFGPRGTALASYDITESRTILPGAATHVQFEMPLTGVIEKRHGDTLLVATPGQSILSAPADTDFSWRPSGEFMRCLSMSLPVAVLEDFLQTSEHAFSISSEFASFDDAYAGLDAPFFDLVRYILDHFERFAALPEQGNLAETLLLETFASTALEVGFFIRTESVGIRPGTKGSSADARLVARAENYFRENYHMPLFMPEVAKELGVSLRKLQETFRKQRGVTPRISLSEIRLERARKRLSDPVFTGNVTTAAIDCGIAHFGRFSGAYLEAFGEYPSDTLKRMRNLHWG